MEQGSRPDERPAGHVEMRGVDLRLTPRDLALIFAFWTIMAVLTAANRTLYPRGAGTPPVIATVPVALSFIESYLWAALTPPLFWLSERLSLERRSAIARVAIAVVAGVIVAAGVVAIMNLCRLALASGAPPAPPPRFQQGGAFSIFNRLWFLNDLIVYMGILAAGAARAYSLRYRERRAEGVRLEAEAAELHAQLAEARLDALRMQLDPHFLFNTLHAISSLLERDPSGVRRMITRLSELLRHTIEGPPVQEIPLRNELDLLRRYLDIMEIRFQGHLEVSTHVDEHVLDALVPNLILQPIAENAIKHGISKVTGVGRIEIRAQREGEQLVLCVWNNGPTNTESLPATDGGGLGLRNTRARLAQLYGPDQQFVLHPAPEEGMVAEIKLPYHTQADLRVHAVSADD